MKATWGAGVALASLFVASNALAQEPNVEYTLSPNAITIKTPAGSKDLPLPDCEPKAIARDGNRVYVACGPNGIVVLDAANPQSPTVSGRLATDGEATAFHTVNGKPWVELTHVDARPVDSLVRSSAAVAIAPGTLPAAAAPIATTTQPSAPTKSAPSLLAPDRHGDIWELNLDAHLFLTVGNIGFGNLNSISIGHRFQAPIAVYGELSPIGFGVGKQGTIGTVAANAIVALDTHLFEAGLGIGGATLNDPRGTSDTSVSFAQHARIGARDGLALFVRNIMIIDRDQFELGGLSITGQARLAEKWWLMIRGGGGNIGYAFGDLGVRYLISGDLGPGSFFLTGAAGGAMIMKERVCEDFNTCNRLKANYIGPSISVGIELRF